MNELVISNKKININFWNFHFQVMFLLNIPHPNTPLISLNEPLDWFHQQPISICPCCIQLSYIVVDLLIWWGIRGYINDFRKRKLKLAPIAYFSTYHGSISHLPTGYMWSPHLVPKPKGRGLLVCTRMYDNHIILDDTLLV